MNLASPPRYVEKLILRLESAGHEAYLVGGCVRDLALGRRPKDWDVATSALPERVMELFSRTLPTGLRHGTVTVIIAGRPAEVTTYRVDEKYSDHRRPDGVVFCSDLSDDLVRRDFTVNAMALSIRGELVDPADGMGDLEKKLIRCVGAPERRFEEDSLRMLRAIRFSAQLGFSIEERTREAIASLAELAASLSAERVASELSKTLSSPRPELAAELLRLGLLDRFLTVSRPPVELGGLSRIPSRVRPLRLAALCAALERGGAISSVEDFLRALKFDRRSIRVCALGVSAALECAPTDAVGWKILLSERGEDAAWAAAAALELFSGKGALRALRSVLESGECHKISQLRISGEDLLSAGISGAEVGNVLRALLRHVIANPGDNERSRLLKLAAETISGERLINGNHQQ